MHQKLTLWFSNTLDVLSFTILAFSKVNTEIRPKHTLTTGGGYPISSMRARGLKKAIKRGPTCNIKGANDNLDNWTTSSVIIYMPSLGLLSD